MSDSVTRNDKLSAIAGRWNNASAQGEGTFTDIITFPAVGDPTGESF